MYDKAKLVKITDLLVQIYEKVFDQPMEDVGKDYAPPRICINCSYTLRTVAAEKDASYLRFHIPAIWRSPASHPTHCYFCSTNNSGVRKNQSYLIKYPVLEACVRPQVLDSYALPDLSEFVLTPPRIQKKAKSQLVNEEEIPDESISDDECSDFEKDFVSESNKDEYALNVPVYTIGEFNDLVRNARLSKNDALSLAKTFKSKNAFAPGVTFYHIRDRDRKFHEYFKTVVL